MGFWAGALRRFLRHKGGVIGLAILSLIILLVLLAPLLAPYDPIKPNYAVRLQGPSLGHLLGTDELGRDLLSRMLWGGRLSLSVGVIAVLVGMIFGTALGLLSGFYKGADSAISRAMDILLSVPGLLLEIAIVATLGAGLQNVMIAVGIFSIPSYVRVVRASVLSAREAEYVEAARAVGVRDIGIMVRHLLPNVLGPLIVVTTFGLAGSILSASALSFLGLGVQPPNPEWGAILNQGRSFMLTAPWMVALPGAVITTVILCLNLVGDGLRDALDPRLK
ncbi:MAG: binding-protein-dependent transport system inner rane component [Firmicutes bacterium]|nr:binding-protein-dependent transport system inner rane component [Bacillota bacterium]